MPKVNSNKKSNKEISLKNPVSDLDMEDIPAPSLTHPSTNPTPYKLQLHFGFFPQTIPQVDFSCLSKECRIL